MKCPHFFSSNGLHYRKGEYNNQLLVFYDKKIIRGVEFFRNPTSAITRDSFLNIKAPHVFNWRDISNLPIISFVVTPEYKYFINRLNF